MISVAIIFDNFGPYHMARLRAAAAVCALSAIEVAGKSSVYAWNRESGDGDFRRITLVEQATSGDVARSEIVARLERALEEINPGVVFVPGWASPAAWGAMSWCLRKNVPAVCMSESTEWDEPRIFWKEWIKRRLVSCFSAALVGGQRHRDYLAKLGLPRERIFFGYDAVDNHYFYTKAALARSSADAVRARRGLPERYFLASARFVEKKNLVRLLEAYARYRGLCAEPWSLVLLGDGDLRGELENKRRELGLDSNVLMPGFVQYDALPEYYALAGAFVHPSTIEPWGLVVNEALASGLPVLVSDRCGCAPELVNEGGNGFTFNPLDVDEIADKMAKLSAADFPRAEFRSKSEKISSEWCPERFAQGALEAVKEALARGPARPGLIERNLLELVRRR